METYQTISELTDRGIATGRNITQEVSNLIATKLWKKFVVFPKTEEEFLSSINAMETLWQFPTAFGGVDGCHIPLKCPHGGNEARKEYYNFKNFYSVVMMGIVGADYRFLWASAGLPGSVNDACSFQACKLYQDINNGKKLPEIYKTIKSIQIPPLILGDSVFPHQTWLQKPCTCANLTDKQSYFNFRLSRARMVTECAFGQLKGSWRVLYRKCEPSQESLKINILACIALHNICIEKEDLITQNLDFTLQIGKDCQKN